MTDATSVAGPPGATLPDPSPLQRLLDGKLRPGAVHWIGLRPARHAPMQPVAEVTLRCEDGVTGDHYHGRSGTRQVSLITRESLDAIASFLGRDRVGPDELRRNLVVAGINLLALKGRRLRIGDALLEVTGECHPCSRMEQILGPGGYNAVRGQGGILARVLEPGRVRLGDTILRIELDPTGCY